MTQKNDGDNLIAFQGEFGANSDTACRNAYPDMEPFPCATFADALAAVKSGQCKLGMIAIENTLAGRVADIHDMLPDSDLHIVAEYFLPIHFHLMVVPGTKIEEIKTVYSHVHAIGQCREIVAKYGWQVVVAGDTAGSARIVSELNDPTIAAFAPELAAELYGVEILQRRVEDAAHNTTRFVVLSRDPVVPARDVPVTTCFVFRVRNVPAALYKAMGGFATNGVNMTKLESYMIDGRFTATQFLAEIEGHPDDENVKLAMEELAFYTDHIKILGVYPISSQRENMY